MRTPARTAPNSPSGLPDIRHHGAVTGVTGSCHELRYRPDATVLVDCGLFQGVEAAPDGAGATRLAIGFDLGAVRALAVTHCHIDHVGRIPHLLAAGFAGPILCSPPSAELLPRVLKDALGVGFTRDRSLTRRVLGRVEALTEAVPYGRWRELPGGGAALRLQPAGHILGSAYVECRLGPDAGVEEGTTVVFSGDLGGPDTPLLAEPRPPARADVVVLESTYGDRVHEGRADRVQRLRAVVERSLADGGAVLIPAFSIGRTQELLYELEQIIHQVTGAGGAEGTAASYEWGALPVIVDSPLAARFTAVYRRLWAYWDAEARARVDAGRHPLAFAQRVTVDGHGDHLRVVEHLRETGRPAIVIAASGMCAGGRIVNYLKALIGDPRCDILFVGYQAEGTPGRDIQTYGPRGGWVELDGVRYGIRARVQTLGGYSAHADSQALTAFVTGIPVPLRQIRLVHGSATAKVALARALEARLPATAVVIPTQ